MVGGEKARESRVCVCDVVCHNTFECCTSWDHQHYNGMRRTHRVLVDTYESCAATFTIQVIAMLVGIDSCGNGYNIIHPINLKLR